MNNILYYDIIFEEELDIITRINTLREMIIFRFLFDLIFAILMLIFHAL